MFYPFYLKTAQASYGKDVLGGKGHSLHAMRQLGVPVPPGFVIGTEACKMFQDKPDYVFKALSDRLPEMISKIEYEAGRSLYSVRSGAPVSMPGMMDTILNVGLTTENLDWWGKKIGQRSALDCYRRLIQMLGTTAFGVPCEAFDELLSKAKFRAKVTEDSKLTADQLCELIVGYTMVFKLHTGVNFPDTREEQIRSAVGAVFRSWMNPRAVTYRKLNKISDSSGTAVVIQAMVFGNMNDNSGSGVLFSRDPNSGEPKMIGEFLPNAQGEDVVAGIRTPAPLQGMEEKWPEAYSRLSDLCKTLEGYYKDMVDVEFTVQNKKLWLLQCRPGKRSALASVRIAYDMRREGRITLNQVRERLKDIELANLTRPQVDPAFKIDPAYTGIGATCGVVTGKVVLTSEAAEKADFPCILVTQETDPDDIGGMAAAIGILTRTGGATSHAAVVARGMDKPCIVGCTDLPENLSVLEGRTITMCASSGRVWGDIQVPVIGGASDNVLAKLIGLLSAEKFNKADDQPLCLAYQPELIDQAAIYLTFAEFKAIPAEALTDLVQKLRHGQSVLTIDFESKTLPEDEQLDVLWGAPETEEMNVSVLSKIPADARSDVLLVGDSELIPVAKANGFAHKTYPETLSDVLEHKTLRLNDSIVKKLGGVKVADKLKKVLESAGFQEKPLVRAVPWQYAVPELVKGIVN